MLVHKKRLIEESERKIHVVPTPPSGIRTGRSKLMRLTIM